MRSSAASSPFPSARARAGRENVPRRSPRGHRRPREGSSPLPHFRREGADRERQNEGNDSINSRASRLAAGTGEGGGEAEGESERASAERVWFAPRDFPSENSKMAGPVTG